MTAALARRPRRVVTRAGSGLTADLARIGAGPLRPRTLGEGPAVHRGGLGGNPLFKRTLQGYLAFGEAARGLVDDAELGWGDGQRMGFIVDNLVEATAPSNNPVLNPTVLKAASTPAAATSSRAAGGSCRDLATPPRVPSMVEADAFEVGRGPRGHPRRRGAAHRRLRADPVHAADRAKVREVPLLIVPPTINKYYVDRPAPGRSMVEHLVRQAASRSSSSPGATPTPGTPTGVWTPTARPILEAMDACEQITRPRRARRCSGSARAG